MTEVTRIIAAVVDTQRLTLYRQDGTTIVVPQGDTRIRPLVDKVIPALESQQFCDLTQEELMGTNHYAEAQAGMGGFVQFFRLFKSTMEDMLGRFSMLDQPAQSDTHVVEACSAGQIPQPATAGQMAVAEIMANATPATSQDFQKPMTEQETVVAVLESGEVIPGMEKLDLQIQALASKLGSAEGVKNFLRRVASVPRAHSIQDLLTFMEKGELPIADDGSVLVYKRLESSGTKGVFVDCHSKKVLQKVGSHVFMDEKLVDPDRTQDCSNGLHVARRDYLSSFSGDVCVLAKLAPEDVIAVPHRDARKLRAKGYHIIAQLSEEDARRVCSDRPMADTVLLGNAVKGNHIGILETVEITGHEGKGLVITPVAEAAEVVLEEAAKASSLDELPTQKAENTKVDAVKVAKQVAERKTGRQQQAEALLNGVLTGKTGKVQIQKAKELIAFKKAAKVSWERLGITEKEAQRIIDIADGTHVPEPAPAKKEKPVKAAPWKPSGATPRERIQSYLSQPLTKEIAEAIFREKKDAKKGWDKLGVSDTEVAKILKLAGK